MRARHKVVLGAMTGALAAAAANAQAATLYVTLDSASQVDYYANAGTGASTYTGSASSFSSTNPYGVAVDSSGDVYVAQANGASAEPVTAYGPTGTQIVASSAFGYNNNNVFQSGSNTLYASSYNNGSTSAVYQLTENNISGGGSPSLSVNSTPVFSLSGGVGINQTAVATYNGQTFLYIASYAATSNNILAVNLSNPAANTLSNGAEYEQTVFSTGNKAAGLAVDSSGNVWVTQYTSPGNIDEITGNGTNPLAAVSPITLAGGSTGSLVDPNSIAFGPDGNLYIANNGAPTVDELNVSTDFLSTYLTVGAHPYALAFTPTPEPGSLCLLALGAGGLLRRRRGKRMA